MSRKTLNTTGDRLQNQPEFNQVETYLNWTLEPITPRQEFVEKLRGQLAARTNSHGQQLSTVEYFIFGAAGVVGSIVLLITSIRAALALVEAIKYLSLNRRKIVRSRMVRLS